MVVRLPAHNDLMLPDQATYAIRRAVAADIEACLPLALRADPGRPAATWRDVLLREVETPEHQLFVAAARGAIVGYGRAALFEPGPDAPADTAPGGFDLTGVFVRD